MDFKGRDIISIYDFSKAELLYILKIAKKLDICDYNPGANVVKSKEGKIKFYDFEGQAYR